jgi:hypothetical protein
MELLKRNLFILLLLLICLSGCGEAYRYSKSGEVGWALKKAIRDQHKHEVVLKELTRFSWDELFLFSPYEPTSEVCKRLGLSPTECKETIKNESTDDGEMLMVFRNKGKVVHVEMHFRWHGDFTPVPEKPLTPASAIFLVVPDGKGASGRDWLRLRPKTEQAPTS